MLELGALEQAEALFQSILQDDPGNVVSLQLLGVIQLHRGEHEAGAHFFRRALELRPRSVMSYLNLGIALWNLQRLDEARVAFERASIFSPNHIDALLNLSLVLQQMGKSEESLTHLTRILSVQPDHLSALLHLGNGLMNLERHAEAIVAFEHALAVQADHLEARKGRWLALIGAKRLAEALADLDSLLVEHPEDTDCLIARGAVLFDFRRVNEALAMYDQVLRIKPIYFDALYNKYVALQMLQRTADAENCLSQMLSIHGNQPADSIPKSRILLAKLLMDLGRYDDALQLLVEPFAGSNTHHLQESENTRRWHIMLLRWLKSFLEDPLQGTSPFKGSGPRYILPMVVWGDRYLDTMEQFTLPSLMAVGNLPYLQTVGEVKVVFFTSEAGATRIKGMPGYQDLGGALGAEIITFPEELTGIDEAYRLMSTMHLACMVLAKLTQSHFLFLAPDLIFANNFLRALDQRRQAGYEVVFAPGLILHLESFAEEQGRDFPLVERRLSLDPRALLNLGLRHLHPFVKKVYAYTADARRSTVAVFLWPMASGGYAMHGNHHTPFFISADALARFDGSMFLNLDGDFLPKIVCSQTELDRCVLLTDTSETNYFELSRLDRFPANLEDDLRFDMGEFTIERLGRFSVHLGMAATWLFPQQVCFDPAGSEADDPARKEARAVVGQIMEEVQRHRPCP